MTADEPPSGLPWHPQELLKRVFAASRELPERCTVPIAGVSSRGDVIPHGTGVLLQIGDFKFLVMAEHVIDSTLQGNELPFIVMQHPDNPPARLVAQRGFSCKPMDLAVAELADELSDYLLEDYTFLRLKNVWMPREALPDPALFLIVGYPFAGLTNDDTGVKFIPVWKYAASIYSGFVTKDIDESRDLLLDYEHVGYNLDGQTTVNPKAPGISGCGIWAIMRPHALIGWSADDLRLAAIEISWHKKLRYIRGTKVCELLRRMWEQFPETRDALRLHGVWF